VVMRVDWRLAAFGAFGFGLAANHMGLAEAGHATKIVATAYLPPMLASVLLLLRGRYLLGGGLLGLFSALEVYANHVQMTYYFFLTMLVLGIVYGLHAWRNGTLPHFLRVVGMAAAAVAIGVACNTGRLWTTYEYAQETIRGQSELTQKTASSGSSAEEGGGLSKEYAFQWSYGLLESFNMLIPNYVGGSSNENFTSDASSRTMQALRQMSSGQDVMQLAQQASHYWGPQPFTGGPVYLGVVFILLFFLGAHLIQGPLKQFAVAAVVLTLFISWGKNFSAFNYLLFDYFPLFNKFRAVTMILGITNMLVIFLGMLGLQAYLSPQTRPEARRKALFAAGVWTGGLFALALLFSFTTDYGTEGLPEPFASALAEDRAALLYSDLLRSLALAAGAFALLWAFSKRWLGTLPVALALGALLFIDIWGIAKRFISEEDFLTPQQKERITEPTEADRQILADPDPHYRVADFRRNPWADALTSYHHKSMGGYHAAKLMRYQELIEGYLGNPVQNAHIYGMLNCKYFISPGQGEQGDRVSRNPKALGNAWFVPEFFIVKTADEEFQALAGLDPRQRAVVQEKYAAALKGFQLQYDSSATIRLTKYHPDEMVYTYSAATPQLALFSEVYYPPEKGWQLYVDGEPTGPLFKADFILRAAVLPAGQNRELRMVFEPHSYYAGEKISLGASLIMVLFLVGMLLRFFRAESLPEPSNLAPLPPEKKPAARPKGKGRSRRKK